MCKPAMRKSPPIKPDSVSAHVLDDNDTSIIDDGSGVFPPTMMEEELDLSPQDVS